MQLIEFLKGRKITIDAIMDLPRRLVLSHRIRHSHLMHAEVRNGFVLSLCVNESYRSAEKGAMIDALNPTSALYISVRKSSVNLKPFLVLPLTTIPNESTS